MLMSDRPLFHSRAVLSLSYKTIFASSVETCHNISDVEQVIYAELLAWCFSADIHRNARRYMIMLSVTLRSDYFGLPWPASCSVT